LSCSRRSSKASEMYFKKMSPSTMCLYSAASMEERSLSAAAQRVFLRSWFTGVQCGSVGAEAGPKVFSLRAAPRLRANMPKIEAQRRHFPVRSSNPRYHPTGLESVPRRATPVGSRP